MLSVLMRARKSLGQIVVAGAALILAACVPASGPAPSGGNASGKIQVALLVPAGSGQASDELLARSLQNAARMAGLLRYDKGLLLKYNPGGPHEGANGRQLCDISLRKKRGRLKIRAALFLFFNAAVRVVVII